MSAARLCLFASRDVWFVIALPVYLMSEFQWAHENVGAFLAFWVIGYGFIQAKTPKILQAFNQQKATGNQLAFWAFLLGIVCLFIIFSLYINYYVEFFVVAGLLIFGAVFAINSSMHSYAVVSLARDESVSMDVGFYYMANALGRLLGTVLSGWLFQQYGLMVCIIFSATLALLSAYFVRKI